MHVVRRVREVLYTSLVPVTVLATVIAVAAVATAIVRDHHEWGWDDWASMTASFAVGLVLFVGAHLLEARQAQLARGLADLALQEKVGQIRASSLRSFISSDLSLVLAPEALAGLHLFPFADRDQMLMFLDAVEAGYSALTLHVFPNSRLLPEAACKRVQADGLALARALGDLVSSQPDEGVARRLQAVSDHVRVCLDFQRAWRAGKVPPAIPPERVEVIYRGHLQVDHAWSDPTVSQLRVTVEYADLAAAMEWHAPWYLKEQDGLYFEVGYHTRRHQGQPFRAKSPLTQARPLQHGVLATLPLRRDGIRRMQQVLLNTRPEAIVVLAYRLASGAVVVLDGNHRLAAAIRLSRLGRLPSLERVIAFVLTEGHGESTPASHERWSPPHVDRWEGFNPDVQMLRKAMQGHPNRPRRKAHAYLFVRVVANRLPNLRHGFSRRHITD